MKYKLLQYKENMYSNYWLTPIILSIFSVALSFLTLYLDHKYSWLWLKSEELIYTIGPDGARIILSTIASAVITITSVTFSITVLTLSIASNQLGPRLLPNFMRQGRTQFVLGSFIATFIYSLLILRSIRSISDQALIPYFSIILSIIFGIFAFFLLIYFIHYVCHVIQIDNVLSYLSKEMISSIERQFPSRSDNENKNIAKTDTMILELKTAFINAKLIRCKKTGYIQTIDYSELMDIAKSNDVILRILYRPGDYVFCEVPIVMFSNDKKLNDKTGEKIRNCFQLGMRRTSVQDVEFSFEQLVEIAVRALSPSLNNPYTAINCLDRIAEGLEFLNHRVIPQDVLYDSENYPRVMRKAFNYTGIVNIAFNRLRQEAKNDLSVAIRILEISGDLLKTNLILALKKAVFKQAEMTYQDTIKQSINSNDKHDLDCHFQEVQKIYSQ